MTVLSRTMRNMFAFIKGISIGLALDVLITRVHAYIKKRRRFDNYTKILLISLVLFQLFIVFYFIEILNFDTYARLGILTSQVFIFDYAIKHLYKQK